MTTPTPSAVEQARHVIARFIVDEVIGDDGSWSNGYAGGYRITDKLIATLAAVRLKILPREPTEAMCEAYRRYYRGDVEGDAWVVGWDAAP